MSVRGLPQNASLAGVRGSASLCSGACIAVIDPPPGRSRPKLPPVQHAPVAGPTSRPSSKQTAAPRRAAGMAFLGSIGRMNADFTPRLPPWPGQHNLPRLPGPTRREKEAAQGQPQYPFAWGRSNRDRDLWAWAEVAPTGCRLRVPKGRRRHGYCGILFHVRDTCGRCAARDVQVGAFLRVCQQVRVPVRSQRRWSGAKPHHQR